MLDIKFFVPGAVLQHPKFGDYVLLSMCHKGGFDYFIFNRGGNVRFEEMEIFGSVAGTSERVFADKETLTVLNSSGMLYQTAKILMEKSIVWVLRDEYLEKKTVLSVSTEKIFFTDETSVLVYSTLFLTGYRQA